MLKRLAAGALAAMAAGAIFVGHPAGQPSVAGSPVSACRKVVVTDAHTGRPLRGIEDIAVNAAANIAYLSADDRWAVEEGAARNAMFCLRAASICCLSTRPFSARIALRLPT
jgi:hypothetical protein